MSTHESFKLDDFRGFASDFDGTISNSLKVHTETETAAFEYMAGHTNDGRFRNISPAIVQEAKRNGSNDTAIIAGVLVMAGIVEDAQDQLVLLTVEEKRRLYSEKCKQGMDAQPNAVRLLRTLHKLRPDSTFLCTTAYDDEVVPFLNKHGLADMFPRERRVVYEDVGQDRLKPHPRAYQIPLRRIGETAAGDFLAFEDTPIGLKSANAAGLFSVGVCTTHSEEELRQAKPDLLFENHRELLSKMGSTARRTI